jgi:hypothetical protein
MALSLFSVIAWINFAFGQSTTFKFQDDIFEASAFGAKVAASCFDMFERKRETGANVNYDHLDADDFCISSIIQNGEITPEWITSGNASYTITSLSRQLVESTHFKNHQFFEDNKKIYQNACIGTYIYTQMAALIHVDQFTTFERMSRLTADICSLYGTAGYDRTSAVILYLHARSQNFPFDLSQTYANFLQQAAYQEKARPEVAENLEIYAGRAAIRAISSFPTMSESVIAGNRLNPVITFRMAYQIANHVTSKYELQHLRSFLMANVNDVAAKIGDENLKAYSESELWRLEFAQQSYLSKGLNWIKRWLVSPGIVGLLGIASVILWFLALYDQRSSKSKKGRLEFFKNIWSLSVRESKTLLAAQSPLSIKERIFIVTFSAFLSLLINNISSNVADDLKAIKARAGIAFERRGS